MLVEMFIKVSRLKPRNPAIKHMHKRKAGKHLHSARKAAKMQSLWEKEWKL